MRKQELTQFYAGKNVFLTGGTGFKGSWLCLMLQTLGAKVFDYSLEPPSNPSLWKLVDILHEVEHYRANILDRTILKEKMLAAKPDIVIHLAAQSLVRPSYTHPYDTLETNIMGTASVLDAVLACDTVRATIIVTSDKCYENIEKMHSYTEQDPMGGYDPYSASKGCAELICNAYRRSFFADTYKGLASARAGNVIGGGDFAKDRLIPDMVRAFSQNQTLTLRYPKATRPWQHVLDPLFGYLLLAKAVYTSPSEYSEAWNFGPFANETHQVGEVVKLFSQIWEKDARYAITQEIPAHEASLLSLDCTKANNKLGWRPKMAFQESVEWAATWYKAWHNGENVKVLCQKQIQDFLEI